MCRSNSEADWSLHGWHLPPVELLHELDFIVRIHKLRVSLTVVSQVIDQMLEGSSVTINEDFVIDLLELVETVEHLGQSGIGTESQHVSLSHHVVSAADIQGYDFGVQSNEIGYLFLLQLPQSSLLGNERLLLIEASLHVKIPSLEVFELSDERLSQLLVLIGLVRELVAHLVDVVVEHHLNLLDAHSPFVLDLADLANVLNLQ